MEGFMGYGMVFEYYFEGSLDFGVSFFYDQILLNLLVGINKSFFLSCGIFLYLMMKTFYCEIFIFYLEMIYFQVYYILWEEQIKWFE